MPSQSSIPFDGRMTLDRETMQNHTRPAAYRHAGDKGARETKTTNHELLSDASSAVSGVDAQVEQVRFQRRGPGGIGQQDELDGAHDLACCSVYRLQARITLTKLLAVCVYVYLYLCTRVTASYCCTLQASGSSVHTPHAKLGEKALRERDLAHASHRL